MFANLKITAYMGNHTAVSEYIRLDCVLSAAKAKELLKDEYYLNPKTAGEKNLVIKTLSEFLAFDAESSIFHASCGIGDGREFATSFSKRWNAADDEKVNFIGKGKKIIDISRGNFKSYHKATITRAYKEIVFYARGDKEIIENLLNKYIHYLGKKGSQGFGTVIRWEVEEIENDFSLVCGGSAMRFLPVEHFANHITTNTEYIRKSSLIPPAWRDDCIELCFMPMFKTGD